MEADFDEDDVGAIVVVPDRSQEGEGGIAHELDLIWYILSVHFGGMSYLQPLLLHEDNQVTDDILTVLTTNALQPNALAITRIRSCICKFIRISYLHMQAIPILDPLTSLAVGSDGSDWISLLDAQLETRSAFQLERFGDGLDFAEFKTNPDLVRTSWSRDATAEAGVTSLDNLGRWDFVFPFYQVARACEAMHRQIIRQMPFVGPGSDLKSGDQIWCGQYLSEDGVSTCTATEVALNGIHGSDASIFTHDLLISPVGFCAPLPPTIGDQGRSVLQVPSEEFHKVMRMARGRPRSEDRRKWAIAMAELVGKADFIISELVECWNDHDPNMIVMTNTVVMISGGAKFVERCKNTGANELDPEDLQLMLFYGNTGQAWVSPTDDAPSDPSFKSFQQFKTIGTNNHHKTGVTDLWIDLKVMGVYLASKAGGARPAAERFVAGLASGGRQNLLVMPGWPSGGGGVAGSYQAVCLHTHAEAVYQQAVDIRENRRVQQPELPINRHLPLIDVRPYAESSLSQAYVAYLMRLESLVTGGWEKPARNQPNWGLSNHPPILQPNPNQVYSSDLEISFGIPREFEYGVKEFVGGRKFGLLNRMAKMHVDFGGNLGVEVEQENEEQHDDEEQQERQHQSDEQDEQDDEEEEQEEQDQDEDEDEDEDEEGEEDESDDRDEDSS